MTERIATTEARLEGFYWVVTRSEPPEIAYWERGEWVARGRCEAVAAGGGDRRQRALGVQAAIVVGGVMTPRDGMNRYGAA